MSVTPKSWTVFTPIKPIEGNPNGFGILAMTWNPLPKWDTATVVRRLGPVSQAQANKVAASMQRGYDRTRRIAAASL